MAAKASEWRPGPTVCRCCFAEGCYKDISTEYFWMGKREVYSEMLTETFDVSIAYSQSSGPNSNSRLICEPCISRLRDASDFKRQVLECERTFMQHLDPGRSSNLDLEVRVEPCEKEVKLERVKLERKLSNDDDFDNDFAFADDDDDDMDDQPLTKLASKVPKKESVDILDLLDNAKAVKRKSTTKVKASPSKKTKKKETAKPTASKSAAKPEKKKKVIDTLLEARSNAKILLKYTTAYPFRMPGADMLCVYCCESFDDPAGYRAHMQEEHKTFHVETACYHLARNYNEYIKVDCTDLKCRICLAQFEEIQDIAEHLKEVHNKKINMNVESGMQTFKFGLEKWICATCNLKCPTLRILSRHTSSHYHKYTCEACARSYTNAESLNRHVLVFHSKGKMCTRCKKSFPDTETRRNHVLMTQKCWPQSCSFCGQRFVNRKAKFEHLANEHGQKPKVYNCPECGETYNNYRLYRSHFVVSHTNDSYECSYCGLKLPSKKRFDDHVVVHTNERAFPCTYCSKSFSRKKNLSQHLWIHREIKRFECTTCNKQFNQRVSWKTHMKSYHPELVDF